MPKCKHKKNNNTIKRLPQYAVNNRKNMNIQASVFKALTNLLMIWQSFEDSGPTKLVCFYNNSKSQTSQQIYTLDTDNYVTNIIVSLYSKGSNMTR